MNSNVFAVGFSDAAISNLTSLIGENVYRIYSPVLEVRKSIVSADCFSLEIFRKGYLILDGERLETPNDYVNYWHLNAQVSTDRKYGEWVTRDTGTGGVKAQSSIELLDAAQPIRNINIYETENFMRDTPSDVAKYDCAIEFICEDRKRYGIYLSNWTGWPLCFSADNEILDNALKDCELRLSL